jgi:prephenate dehydratase
MEGQRLYRAELGSRVDAKTGHSTLSWYGTVTECGEWVEQGQTRWRRDDTWFETEAAALASLADRIEAVALAMNRQARRLRFAVSEEVADAT